MKLIIAIILIGFIVGVAGFIAEYKWAPIISLLIVAELVVLLLASKKKVTSVNTKNSNKDE